MPGDRASKVKRVIGIGGCGGLRLARTQAAMAATTSPPAAPSQSHRLTRSGLAGSTNGDTTSWSAGAPMEIFGEVIEAERVPPAGIAATVSPPTSPELRTGVVAAGEARGGTSR